jgi:hypothetical protein
LYAKFEQNNDPEVQVVKDVRENVQLICVHSAVQHVENVHQQESVKAKGVQVHFASLLSFSSLLVFHEWLSSDDVKWFIEVDHLA